MAKQPSLKKAWITKSVIKTLADGMVPWKASEIRKALTRLTEQTDAVRTRTKKGRLEFRATDVAFLDCDMELYEKLTEQLSAEDLNIISNCGWAVIELFDPKSIKENRKLALTTLAAVGALNKAPRDQIWFSDIVFNNVLDELEFDVKGQQKVSTLLENKLALLQALAGCDEEGAPQAVTNLRTTKTIDDVWLNVQDLVYLGQDDAALAWLRKRLKPNFGPQSILLTKEVAKTLQKIYPTDPEPATTPEDS